jgi:hypothetical protein
VNEQTTTMREALRLTRAGQLPAATALLQRACAAPGADPPGGAGDRRRGAASPWMPPGPGVPRLPHPAGRAT